MVIIEELKRKICLIGDPAVGKTSLVRKFVLDQFDDKYLSTFGAKVYKKRIQYQKDPDHITDINLVIWDVMGQAQFEKTQDITFKGSNGAMIVCDITRKDTMVNVINWKVRLFNITDQIPILIIANKIDLKNEVDFSIGELNELCKNLKVPFFVSSAKTGQNVEAAFKELGSFFVSKVKLKYMIDG